MSTRLVALAVAVGLVGLAPAVAPAAQSATTPIAHLAKTCSPGFKHAVINGQQKCLRRGEFCGHAYDHRSPRPWPYSHYGYRCVKRDSGGNYHLT